MPDLYLIFFIDHEMQTDLNPIITRAQLNVSSTYLTFHFKISLLIYNLVLLFIYGICL